jgi:hypothetical protein
LCRFSTPGVVIDKNRGWDYLTTETKMFQGIKQAAFWGTGCSGSKKESEGTYCLKLLQERMTIAIGMSLKRAISLSSAGHPSSHIRDLRNHESAVPHLV